jgi:hypothetical protein
MLGGISTLRTGSMPNFNSYYYLRVIYDPRVIYCPRVVYYPSVIYYPRVVYYPRAVDYPRVVRSFAAWRERKKKNE